MNATGLRSHSCGELRESDVGATVALGGWVHRRRDLGGLVFLDLRDRDGIVQVAFGPVWSPPEVLSRAGSVSGESVVVVRGVVAARPEGQANPDLATGAVEVRGAELEVVGPAEPLAIPVARARGEELAAEELRLRHRHLDLRRPELFRNLLLRHRLLQRARAVLTEHGYLEIETPILTKPTPEGARDYLVPARVYPGEFYALPQSPQLYKQLLMVAGFDRYFQIARCFRDEDLRHDRQPEFTQIDIEASFVGTDDVYRIAEAVLVALWAEAGESVSAPFPRMAYRDAVERFGTDKPDLRFGLEIRDLSPLLADSGDEWLRAALARGERVRAVVAPGGGGGAGGAGGGGAAGAALSRKALDELAEEAKALRVGRLWWAKRGADGLTGPAAKLLGPAAAALALGEGDLVVACAGPDRLTSPALSRLRLELIRRLGVQPTSRHAFVWIEQFPFFAREGAGGLGGAGDEGGELVTLHHPFTAPHPDDVPLLDGAPERVRALHYDPVYNGVELGSGSIRITDPALQARVLARLGTSAEEAERRFGFLLEGLRAGAPPHGGIALGFDRIVMLLAGATSLRDVIAFPKTTAARALFEGAPAPVSAAELEALGLRISS